MAMYIERLIAGAALLTGLSFAGPAGAFADTTVCSALIATAQGAPDGVQGYSVLKSRELFRTQDRPFARIPVGVALVVRAPDHVTATDLHNALTDCTKLADKDSPFCVPGALFRVRIEGGNFVVEVTSKSMSTAREIQARAERLAH